jgi:hypothetical protein
MSRLRHPPAYTPRRVAEPSISTENMEIYIFRQDILRNEPPDSSLGFKMLRRSLSRTRDSQHACSCSAKRPNIEVTADGENAWSRFEGSCGLYPRSPRPDTRRWLWPRA